MDTDARDLLDLLERYYDAVPRTAARAEEVGPFTVFVREGTGWPYYARPALGAAEFTADDVARVRERQRDLGVPESIEWVGQTTPALAAAAREAGMVVTEYPLMVLREAIGAPGVPVRLLGADDPLLPAALAATRLAFGTPGTAVGAVGVDELAAAVAEQDADGWHRAVAERIRAGQTVLATVVVDGVPVSGGQHLPVGPVTELAGIGTLPAFRRLGHGQAITSALVADARSRGATTVFLSAGSDEIARVYGRAGFERVATAMIAEPA